MKKRLCFLIGSVSLVVATGAFWSRGSLNTSRRPARESRALAVGYELRSTTNSTRLIGVSPEFRADLAWILGGMTWNLIDRSPPGDPWAVVRLIITNDHGQALHMSLKDEYPLERLRLLGYRKIAGPGGPENSTQPVRAQNPAPSATDSNR